MVEKSRIHTACVDKLHHQIEELKAAIEKVHESVIGEENSTAGNKFETARAMGQEELERLNRQLSALVRDMNILTQISPTKACDSGQLGSVIQTTRKNIYLSVALGKIEVDNEVFFAVSPSSPIGQNIMGVEKDGKLTFAGKNETIVAVY